MSSGGAQVAPGANRLCALFHISARPPPVSSPCVRGAAERCLSLPRASPRSCSTDAHTSSYIDGRLSLVATQRSVPLQLVPHYAEGVIYPLDLDEVKHWSKVEAKKGDVPDILVDLTPGLDVTTIDFLRIQFHTEWAAFVQRMCAKYRVSNLSPATVTERDFRKKDNGVFSAHDGARMDLMLWASERGQMLSRTVKGMMMYPAALRQLEFLEALHDHGGRLDDLVQHKFRCAAQRGVRAAACMADL